jgi:hypothetical protein
MNTSISVLVVLLVLFYYLFVVMPARKEPMTLIRYRPLMTGQPAPVDYNDNIADLPDPNSHYELPNVNQYANNVAFQPNNLHSANYMMNGESIMDQPSHQYFGNQDGMVSGRN